MIPSPSYLYRRSSGWYFCLNVPADLRSLLKQSQLRYALGTRRVSLAKFRAMYVSTRCKSLFYRVRNGEMKALDDSGIDDSGIDDSGIDDSGIKARVAQWLREALALSESASHGATLTRRTRPAVM